MQNNFKKMFYQFKILFLEISFIFLPIIIHSNPYIDDINKIIEKPLTDGNMDANMGTELQRDYKYLLPFELKDFSIFAELKGFVNYKKSIEDFINNALTFSNMVNLHYLDPNTNKMTLMVKKAYTINENNLKKIDDKKYNDFINNNVFYIIEDDVRVGEIVLKCELKFISENEFTITLTNINNIKFIINLVDAGNYNIFYHFIKNNDGYFIYNAVKVKSKNKLLVWLIKKPEDFQNRLIAFYYWLIKQLNHE